MFRMSARRPRKEPATMLRALVTAWLLRSLTRLLPALLALGVVVYLLLR